MDSTMSFAEENQARRLERVFQVFACAQEEWGVAQDQDDSAKDAEASPEVEA